MKVLSDKVAERKTRVELTDREIQQITRGLLFDNSNNDENEPLYTQFDGLRVQLGLRLLATDGREV